MPDSDNDDWLFYLCFAKEEQVLKGDFVSLAWIGSCIEIWELEATDKAGAITSNNIGKHSQFGYCLISKY